jgi:hypothetical protein
LTNGRCYTVDPLHPITTAIAIRNNQILAVGTDDEMKALLGTGGKWVDLNGRCVTPGLVDAHVHFQGFSMARQRVNLMGTKSVTEALGRIQTTAADRPLTAEGWLQGRGWAQDEWVERQFPFATQLDSVTGSHPACFRDKSGHAAWVNSRALRMAGIDEQTADPPGGHIQRDENGRPTGILFEEAIDMVTRHIPETTLHQLVEMMHSAQTHCWQAGLTGIHDFDGRTCFQALQILRENGELGLRVVKNVPVYRLEHAIGVGLRSGFGDEWIRMGGVKIFADGALGPRTAAMIAPYENAPTNYGIVVTDKEEMMAYASQASANGLSVTVHAIGDKANHDVLEVYEAVRAEEKQRVMSNEKQVINTHHSSGIAHHFPLRHRIEHVQILHPYDLDRLGELGIIASMQPIHATSDMAMADNYWGERSRYSYAWRTMLETGATLVFGSDAPVEPIEPLLGIHAAVTRRRADGSPGPEGWYPEQKLTIQETIHAFTMGAAITSVQETRQGSITPGKLADLTIFDRDIFTIPPDELLDVKIGGTMVGGQLRYQAW